MYSHGVTTDKNSSVKQCTKKCASFAKSTKVPLFVHLLAKLRIQLLPQLCSQVHSQLCKAYGKLCKRGDIMERSPRFFLVLAILKICVPYTAT